MNGKPKTCRVCDRGFLPFSSMQRCCSGECALAWSRLRARKRDAKVWQEQKKAERLELRRVREQAKRKPHLMGEAQRAVNDFCRTLDEFHGLPCLTCPPGAKRPGGYDAGHYHSVGSTPELRFHPVNIHRQCKACNRPGGHTRMGYRAGLVARYGDELVEWLDGPHPQIHWTRDDLRSLRDAFRQRTNELRRAHRRSPPEFVDAIEYRVRLFRDFRTLDEIPPLEIAA